MYHVSRSTDIYATPSTIDVTGETRREPVSPATTRVTNDTTQYDSMAELRAALTDEDPDRRAPAYGAVMEADLEPSAVLGQDPPETALVDAGIIPERPSDTGRPSSEVREEQLSVLKEIRDAVTGGDDGAA